MITGHFVSVEIQEVPAGQDIKATIDFYALNPGAVYWATFLIFDSPQLGRKLLDKAREWGQEGGRKKTYCLGKMPDKDVAISLYIFAHDDAGHDWNWPEYDEWLIWGRPFPSGLEYLAADYRIISPRAAPEPPPEPAVMSGSIIGVEPTMFNYGAGVQLSVDFTAYMESLYYQIKGWETHLVLELNGLSGSDAQLHYGYDGSRTGEKVSVGAMPNHDLSGTLILMGRGRQWSLPLPLPIPTEWEELDRLPLIITLITTPAPPGPAEFPCPHCPLVFATQAGLAAHIEAAHPEAPEPPTPAEGEIPWTWIALAVVGVALLTSPGEKSKK